MDYSVEVIRDHILTDKKIICDENAGLVGGFKSDLFNSEARHLPPISRAHCEEYQPTPFDLETPTFVEEFEKLSLKIRYLAKCYHHLDGRAKKHFRKRQSISADKINQAVADIVADQTYGRHDAFTHLPHCLKIIGMTIHGDLDFSNLDLNFSVRLIGCHIIGGILLDRTQLKTLDLSGCVIEHGISASGLILSGAFRARRLVSHSSVDLAGLKCDGIVDFTDCIFFPKRNPSKSTSHVAQRGILNMAYARLEKGLRLGRSRIYGGINFRNLQTGGILYMNDAILRCSTAHIEMMGATLCKAYGEDILDSLPEPTRITFHAPRELAAYLHKSAKESDNVCTSQCACDCLCQPQKTWKWETIENCEVLYGMTSYQSIIEDPNSLQIRLIAEHDRGADTAIMLESANIGGPVFAQGARISGRVRMKRLIMKGDLLFQGARIRAPRSIRYGNSQIKKTLESLSGNNRYQKEIEHLLNLLNTEKRLRSKSDIGISKTLLDPKGAGRREFLLDLKAATIHGALQMNQGQRQDGVKTPISDALFENKIKTAFDFLTRSIASSDSNFIGSSDLSKLDSKNGLRLTILLGQIRLTNATITGQTSFRHTIFYIPDSENAKFGVDLRKPTIEMKNTVIEGSLDFRNSMGLQSIDAINSHIKGDMKFFNNPSYDLIEEKYRNLTGCAILGRQSVSAFESVKTTKREEERKAIKTGQKNKINDGAFRPPRLRFVGATIEGSVNLLFDPNYFPSLKLAFAQITGRLMIAPANGDLSHRENYSAQTRFPESILKSPGTILKHSIYTTLFGDSVDSGVEKKTKDIRNWAKKYHPMVDLHAVNVPVFTHHPNAWPKPDELVVTGMSYDSTEALGHLYPVPLFWNQVHDNLTRNIQTLKPMLDLVVLCLSFIVTLSFLRIANGAKPGQEILNLFASLFQKSKDSLQEIINHNDNTFFASLLEIIYQALIITESSPRLVLSIMVLGFFWLMQYSAKALSFPKLEGDQSLALPWLRLQRRHFGTRKIYKDVRPTEAYLRAAIVLRTAGRTSSANEVEVARIDEKLAGLSWRKRPITKILFKFFRGTILYGYHPHKAVLICALFTLGSAILFNMNHGAFAPKDPSINPGQLPPLIYAVDLFVPIINLGTTDTWVHEYPGTGQGIWLYRIMAALKVMGWAAITLIAMSVATRLETIWAKSRIV